MIKDYDQEFGPNGIYAWPGCLDVAKRFIEGAPYAESSADYLNDYFFYEYLDFLDVHLFDQYPYEEALELVEAAAKSRQELFKEARNWPLPYLVASATYKILSAKVEEIYMIDRFWDCFFWPALCFDEPLFGMLRAKGWDKIYRNEIREGFNLRLSFEIDGLIDNPLMWGIEEGKPWLTGQCFTSHIYPEDILRCLDLVGIDRGLAQSAVDKVFKLQSLTPLYDVLSDDPSSIPATDSHRGEEEETESPKKPSADLRIPLVNSIYVALLLAGAAIASTRLRSSRSNWASTRPVPCFAASNLNWGCIPIPKGHSSLAE